MCEPWRLFSTGGDDPGLYTDAARRTVRTDDEYHPRLMQFVLDALEKRGGVATTGQLARLGVDRQRLDIAYMYRRIVRIKRGVWALPSVPPNVIAAHRAGGRLACVSALAFHGVIEDTHSGLHIAAPSWVTRWRSPQRADHIVAHWSRRRAAGDCLAVSVETAWAQFALCRAVAGRDVRLR
jgi:hypothetical protein